MSFRFFVAYIHFYYIQNKREKNKAEQQKEPDRETGKERPVGACFRSRSIE